MEKIEENAQQVEEINQPIDFQIKTETVEKAKIKGNNRKALANALIFPTFMGIVSNYDL